MCDTALVDVRNNDYVFQIDADEFWPKETFREAIKKLEEGHDLISIPHIIFWGKDMLVSQYFKVFENIEQKDFFEISNTKDIERGIVICKSKDIRTLSDSINSDPRREIVYICFDNNETKIKKIIQKSIKEEYLFFNPPRVFRKLEGGQILHIPPSICMGKNTKKISEISLSKQVNNKLIPPIWHMGWCGENRIKRKIEYHGGQLVKPIKEYKDGDFSPSGHGRFLRNIKNFTLPPAVIMEVIEKIMQENLDG
jgi:hypothetical protein